jgi:tetratricopeptide (TPR) repeat protein
MNTQSNLLTTHQPSETHRQFDTISAAVLALLFLIQPFAATPVSAAGRTDWPIVFPPFRNDTGDAEWDWLSTGFPEAIRTKLHGTIYMRALTWEEIGHITSKDANLHGNYVEISKQLRSDLLVVGAFNIRGETIEAIAQCVDPVSGQPLATYRSLGSIHEPTEASNDLIVQIAGALRLEIPPDQLETVRRPATSVAEAMKAHAKGLQVLSQESPQGVNIVEAVQNFREAISLDSDYADPHYRLGTLLQHAKDVEGAEKAYREALRADVDHRDARYRLGLLLIDQDRKSEAMTQLEQSLKQAPEDPQMQAALSSIWFDQYQSNFNQMADEFKKAIAADPDNAQLYVELGDVYSELSKVNEAAAQYKLALQKDPDNATASYKLGMTERNIGKAKSATALFRQAIKNGTDQKRVHFYLGEMLMQQNLAVEASMAFAQAIKAEPNHVQAYWESGRASQAAGNPQDALLSYHQYSQINKSDARPHLEIGKAYLEMGLEMQAMTAFEKSVKVDQTFGEGHVAIGDLFEKQKLTFKAGKAFREALRVQPDHPRAEALKKLIIKYQPAPSGNVRQ